ncbi:MAG: AMP-binding protein [Cyclobacteriaceae bacterium]|nr:AMP-binding protein [Cyclobacteriaceae bacterium]
MASPLQRFYHWEMSTPDNPFLRQPVEGEWRQLSFHEAGMEIRKIAAGLQSLGLPPGSRVAILSKNCAHWIMADLAIWMAGYTSVPLYPTLSAHTIEAILTHCQAQVIFVGKLDGYGEQQSGIPAGTKRVSFPWYGIQEDTTWDQWKSTNPPLEGTPDLVPTEMATIMYTSGTTGVPKGVVATFQSLGFVVESALEKFKLINTKERFFSYLPLSHIAERVLVEMGGLYTGSCINFSESLEKFPENLQAVQPTIFLAVPRIWAKFQEKLQQKIPDNRLRMLLRIPGIRNVLRNTIKRKLGLSRARWIFTGAAPISVGLLEWYDQLGIQIHEVYGMTENLAYSHINLHERRHGTVGKAWENVQVRLADDGEILIKHLGLMSGYYKEAQLTSEAFTPDGFLRTGDQGTISKDGFMTITGRVKDMFKTDKGKYITPAPIEMQWAQNLDVDQVCVVGMGIPQPIVLVTLSEAGRAKSREEVSRSILHTLHQVNNGLEKYERITTAVVMKENWTVENGLLTPTLKVRRIALEKVYVPMYPGWYHHGDVIVWE